VNSEPSAEEMAAIVAAVELCWPRPAVAATEPPSAPGRWRWSGRDWGPGTEMGTARRPRSERRWQ